MYDGVCRAKIILIFARMKTMLHTAAALAFLCGVLSTVSAQTLLSLSDVNTLYRQQARSWVSVHDPSVVRTTGQVFYIVGSHNGFARSTDNMVSWQGVSNNYYGRVASDGSVQRCGYADAYTTHAVKSVTVLSGGVPTEAAFGNFDAKAWAQGNQADWSIDGNMWAPDVMWNPTLGKWCMYMSLNGDAWHSVIVMLAADVITGPYVYQGPVVFSGFINNTVPEISYKKTDLELVLGTQTTLPSRYNIGSSWGNTYPNNIDPCVFWDEDGQLWIAYGSWSGGIFMLKLDAKTGLRDYTQTYPLTWEGSTLKSDPYFGTHVAGGYYVSGEGPYIQHIGRYYYLFLSYGGFAPDGGYEMRIFRSEHPDGPYTDGQGTSAIYSRWEYNVGPGATTNRGMKLLGAYNGWGFQTVGETAQGHNSATADGHGRNFVVYHTKFNDGTLGHQVRTRQLFLNQQGWLCAAPFQFDGETETDDSIACRSSYTKEQLAGTYAVLFHRYRMDHEQMEEVTPVEITLTEAGRITGDYTGTWALTDGTSYVRLTLGGVAYYGVVVQQQVDGTTLKAIAITAAANSGLSMWAWRMEPQSAVAYNVKNYTMPIKQNATVNRNIALYGVATHGAQIEWLSSHPDIISTTGKYSPPAEATRVDLTCRISAGDYAYEQQFTVTAAKEVVPSGDAKSDIAGYYDFDAKPLTNAYATSQQATLARLRTTAVPVLEQDLARFGQVVHTYAGEASANSYVRMPNPLLGQDLSQGFTVSLWVRRDDASDYASTIWSFTDRLGQLATVSQRLWLSVGTAIGFTNGTDSFVANEAATEAAAQAADRIPAAEWALVTLTASAADGVTLYIDGVRKAHITFTSTAGTATTAVAAARLFDYEKVMDMVASAQYFQLGVGAGASSPEASYDDLLIYRRALSANDVRALSTLLNRVNDFTPAGTNDIAGVEPEAPHAAANAHCYDLAGRRVGSRATAASRKGIYIIGGRKVVVR